MASIDYAADSILAALAPTDNTNHRVNFPISHPSLNNKPGDIKSFQQFVNSLPSPRPLDSTSKTDAFKHLASNTEKQYIYECPIEWVVDVLDESNGWFVGTAYSYIQSTTKSTYNDKKIVENKALLLKTSEKDTKRKVRGANIGDTVRSFPRCRSNSIEKSVVQ